MNYNNVPINWSKVDRVISKANRIALTTHENPDGDGLGSEMALYYHLLDVGKDVRIINYSPIPEDYYFLNKGEIFEEYDEELDSVIQIIDNPKFVTSEVVRYRIKEE